MMPADALRSRDTKIQPERAVRIALAVAFGDARLSDRDKAVKLVLQALKQTGWKIVPSEDKP